MPDRLHQDVRSQLSDLSFRPGYPLIITDADEVLLQFAGSFETFLEKQGCVLKLTSYALEGNVRYAESNKPVPKDELGRLIENFFDEYTHKLPVVPGAAPALDALSRRAQIIIVTNIPLERRETRIENLVRQGVKWPLLANTGPKGEIARVLHKLAGGAPSFFIDDAPRNIESVAQSASDIYRIHFVADRRLNRLLGTISASHYRASAWADLRRWIERKLDSLGY